MVRRNTGQVAPIFGTSGPLEEWKWHHNLMVDANTHLKPLHTSILDIYLSVFSIGMLSQVQMVAPLYCYTGRIAPTFGTSGPLEEWKWRHNVTIEVNTHLRHLQTSILDIINVFYALIHCLKCIWLHPYTITRAKLPPDLVRQGHLRSENDVITSQLRLIPTSDLFTHPY